MNKKTFLTAAFIGLIASIIFILVQPLFGMSTLTSRHAAAYINLGGYGETSALFLSWFVHISVSIAYAILSSLIFNINSSALVNTTQVLVFGWLTTLIATPANEFVVKLVTMKKFPDINALAPLNFEVGPKLWLHLVFFAFIIIGLSLTQKIYKNKSKKPAFAI
jgi:hypothetical protein